MLVVLRVPVDTNIHRLSGLVVYIHPHNEGSCIFSWFFRHYMQFGGIISWKYPPWKKLRKYPSPFWNYWEITPLLWKAGYGLYIQYAFFSYVEGLHKDLLLVICISSMLYQDSIDLKRLLQIMDKVLRILRDFSVSPKLYAIQNWIFSFQEHLDHIGFPRLGHLFTITTTLAPEFNHILILNANYI